MSGAVLQPLAAADFAPLAALAETIWRQHFQRFISVAQIEYMLAGRYTAGNLGKYLDAPDRWLDVLWLDGERVGYCSHAGTAISTEMRLEQLYVLSALHGRGLGGLMMRHVEAHARELGMHTLILTVNRHNANSIAVYRHAGFTVREEKCFDIGNGYVMDDYVMEKRLV